MKAEQSALTQSLRTDLKNALEEVEAGNRRSRELEEFKGALGTLLWCVNRVLIVSCGVHVSSVQ
jgi:hypothetical protein